MVHRGDDVTNEEHLATLHPVFAAKVRKTLEECEIVGDRFRITQSLRSLEAQQAIYMQGRHPLGIVNEFRVSIGFPPITEKENRIVTGAPPGYSFHNFGLAADVCYATGKPYSDNGRQVTWEGFGSLAQAHELTWGGWWKRPDRPHVEWSGGLTLAELRAGKRPAID